MQRHFPEAAKENLRQVVGYQLDRLTPFTADNAYFDAHPLQHDKQRKEVLADIHVIPRHSVTQWLRQLEGLVSVKSMLFRWRIPPTALT